MAKSKNLHIIDGRGDDGGIQSGMIKATLEAIHGRHATLNCEEGIRNVALSLKMCGDDKELFIDMVRFLKDKGFEFIRPLSIETMLVCIHKCPEALDIFLNDLTPEQKSLISHAVDDRGLTALMLALKVNNEAALKLIKNGADVNIYNHPMRATPFFAALCLGNKEFVEFCISNKLVDYKAKASEESDASHLDLLVKRADVENLKLIFSLHEENLFLGIGGGGYNFQPLHRAIEVKNLELIKLICARYEFECGSDIHKVQELNVALFQCAQEAIKYNIFEIFEYLYDKFNNLAKSIGSINLNPNIFLAFVVYQPSIDERIFEKILSHPKYNTPTKDVINHFNNSIKFTNVKLVKIFAGKLGAETVKKVMPLHLLSSLKHITDEGTKSSVELARFLVQDLGINPNAEDPKAMYPIQLALESGNIDLCDGLLELGADKSVLLGIIDDSYLVPGRSNLTLLADAIQKHDYDKVIKLTKLGANVHATFWDRGKSIFTLATCADIKNKEELNSNLKIIDFLATQKYSAASIDINKINCSGKTVLETTMIADLPFFRLKRAKKLIDLGATITPEVIKTANTTYLNGKTSIIIAVENGDFEDVQTLVALGADLSVKYQGLSLMHIAAKAEKTKTTKGLNDSFKKIVSYLKDKGLDVNSSDNKGITPLQHAYSGGKIWMAAELVRVGAEKEQISSLIARSGGLYAMQAIESGDLTSLKNLHFLGADMSATKDHKTLLDKAIERDKKEIVKYFSSGQSAVGGSEVKDYKALNAFLLNAKDPRDVNYTKFYALAKVDLVDYLASQSKESTIGVLKPRALALFNVASSISLYNLSSLIKLYDSSVITPSDKEKVLGSIIKSVVTKEINYTDIADLSNLISFIDAYQIDFKNDYDKAIKVVRKMLEEALLESDITKLTDLYFATKEIEELNDVTREICAKILASEAYISAEIKAEMILVDAIFKAGEFSDNIDEGMLNITAFFERPIKRVDATFTFVQNVLRNIPRENLSEEYLSFLDLAPKVSSVNERIANVIGKSQWEELSRAVDRCSKGNVPADLKSKLDSLQLLYEEVVTLQGAGYSFDIKFIGKISALSRKLSPKGIKFNSHDLISIHSEVTKAEVPEINTDLNAHNLIKFYGGLDKTKSKFYQSIKKDLAEAADSTNNLMLRMYKATRQLTKEGSLRDHDLAKDLRRLFKDAHKLEKIKSENPDALRKVGDICAFISKAVTAEVLRRDQDLKLIYERAELLKARYIDGEGSTVSHSSALFLRFLKNPTDEKAKDDDDDRDIAEFEVDNVLQILIKDQSGTLEKVFAKERIKYKDCLKLLKALEEGINETGQFECRFSDKKDKFDFRINGQVVGSHKAHKGKDGCVDAGFVSDLVKLLNDFGLTADSFTTVENGERRSSGEEDAMDGSSGGEHDHAAGAGGAAAAASGFGGGDGFDSYDYDEDAIGESSMDSDSMPFGAEVYDPYSAMGAGGSISFDDKYEETPLGGATESKGGD